MFILVLGVLAALLAFWLHDRASEASARRRGSADLPSEMERGKARRRGASGAALAFQQVFDPGVEHVIRAERDAESDDADPGGGGDDPEAAVGRFRSDLMAALDDPPIDPDQVRRVLASAAREGLDWRLLYDESVRAFLADRPYLAPAVPPPTRVAPRE